MMILKFMRDHARSPSPVIYLKCARSYERGSLTLLTLTLSKLDVEVVALAMSTVSLNTAST